MRRLLQRLFDTSHYPSLVDRDRAYTVMGISALLMLLFAVFATFVRSTTTGLNIWQQAARSPDLSFSISFFYATGVINFLLARTGRVKWGSIGLGIMWLVAVCWPIARGGMVSMYTGMVPLILVLLTGLLNGNRGIFIGTILGVAMIVFAVHQRANLANPPSYAQNLADFITGSLQTIAVGGITYLFLRSVRLSRIEGASRATEERLKLAQLTSQTARRISSRMPLNDVLSNAVEQIRANYPAIYHAQIFLVDEGSHEARLVASTGEIGKFLMQRRHALPVGSLSVIGQVTLTGEPLIARADDPNSIHRRNEALPDTAVEAAFPLHIGEKVIGALDLQSRVATTFQEDDIPSFQSLADHIAVAIDNARLFEETEERLRENQQLVEQARNAVREVERLNRQLTGRAWADYLYGKSSQLSRSVDFADNTVKPEDAWTPTMQEAIQYNYVAQAQSDEAQIIAVPVRVRGQVIGAIEFELDKDASLSPEDLALIQEVGERFGLAAETTRLFEQSQRIAQREALVNEIGVRLQASNNIETTLAEAARSLKQTLRADKVAIRLGTPPGNGARKEGNNA
jgi:GAF domain-containing protein